MSLFKKVPWWNSLDFPTFLSSLFVAILGWIALLSVTSGGWELSPMATRQGGYLAVGFALMVFLSTIDYRKLKVLAWPAYLLSLSLLVAVLIPGIGQSAKGAQRWISLGTLGTLQPSEPAKLAILFLLACFFSKRLKGEDEFPPRLLFEGLALATLPFVLIAIQPDLGTSLVIMAVGFVMLFQSGASFIHLAGIVFAGLGVLPLLLKEYQTRRLMVFFNPDMDPQGAGYNIVQSTTALGSGQVLGRGLFQGQMSQNGFVPENRTDFIITVVGEELGLIGVLGLLGLFLLLFLSLARILAHCDEPLGALIVVGCISMLGFQVVVNVGMTLGLLPVVGLPLPFVSFGGSAMLTNFAALGLAGSVSRIHRTPEFARHIMEMD